jgi:hypothetical protein
MNDVMQGHDFKQFSMKTIATYNLPIYIFCGSAEENILRLLRYCDAHLLKCAAIFTVNTTCNSEKYTDVLSICARMGICVLSPPIDARDLPKGVLICAADLCERQRWLDAFSKDTAHIVVDVYDLFCYPSYAKCLKYFAKSEHLLTRCRTCDASYRNCPIRERYYENKGEARQKAITRLLVRCGFICNYKCEGCSQFLPYFTDRHKAYFDGGEVINDVGKMAATLQYIDDLWLEGGEAMLWKPFPDLIGEVVKFNNVGEIYVLTNGSYIPSRKVLDVLEENRERIHVEVNAYVANSDLPKLFEAFDRRRIRFALRNEISAWYDFSDTSFRARSADELRNIKNVCALFKRDYDLWILTDGKLSALCCEAGYLTHYLNLYGQCDNDYIDIRETYEGNIPEAMVRLYGKGYLDACNYCAGAFIGNQRIQVARQP